MNFSYETQGAITYLVCALDSNEQIDSLTLGMLTNNRINGLAPVLYTEMNGQRYLKYNISAKVSADQFFGGSMNKQRALETFKNILSAICSADEYMIDLNCFSVISEHIFINVSSCETALICIPVVNTRDIHAETAALFRKILFSTQFDQGEDVSYITQLITYINNSANFTVYGLSDLITNLQSGVSTYVNIDPIAPTQQPVVTPLGQTPISNNGTVSPFDSTISIDDMLAMESQNANNVIPMQENVQPFIAPEPSISTQPPISVQPSISTAPPIKTQPSVYPSPSSQKNVPPQNMASQFNIPGVENQQNNTGKFAQGFSNQQKPIDKKTIDNGPSFAIPGASDVPRNGAGNSQIPPVSSVPNKKEDSRESGEKKMSLFGLLSHYNKENADLYKKQKQEAKAKKAANAQKPVFAPVIGGMPTPPQGQYSQQNQFSAPQPPINGFVPPAPNTQSFANPQPPIQPVPVENSFNETTVLSPDMFGGETTVLSAEALLPNPCLVRIKTGERVSINKPVFRIGKEKSYVDYFIADNTAISRSHANIHTENGEYFIEDTNSTNHTYINGKIIASNVKTKLVSGDKVRLANEDFDFTV